MRNITVSRTAGPWGCGLAGYLDGRLVVVLPVKPKSGARWLLAGVTACDRRRVAEAVQETDDHAADVLEEVRS